MIIWFSKDSNQGTQINPAAKPTTRRRRRRRHRRRWALASSRSLQSANLLKLSNLPAEWFFPAGDVNLFSTFKGRRRENLSRIQNWDDSGFFPGQKNRPRIIDSFSLWEFSPPPPLPHSGQKYWVSRNMLCIQCCKKGNQTLIGISILYNCLVLHHRPQVSSLSPS